MRQFYFSKPARRLLDALVVLGLVGMKRVARCNQDFLCPRACWRRAWRKAWASFALGGGHVGVHGQL